MLGFWRFTRLAVLTHVQLALQLGAGPHEQGHLLTFENNRLAARVASQRKRKLRGLFVIDAPICALQEHVTAQCIY